jgi:peptidoglycan/LPS O-acetylase OafA/YrhL
MTQSSPAHTAESTSRTDASQSTDRAESPPAVVELERETSKTVMIPALDAMRGVAILLVVFVHTSHAVLVKNSTLWNVAYLGQFGVQLFFVTSALTLALSWQRLRTRPLPHAVFFVRRLFRIAPLYWTGVLVYGVLWPRHGASTSTGDVPAHLFLVHGLIPEAFHQVVPGGWSIGTEVVFYLLFPAIVILAAVGRNARLAMIVLSTGAVYLLSRFAASEAFRAANGSYLYGCFLNQLPVFLIGFGVAEAYENSRLGSSRSNLSTAIAFFALTVIVWLSPGLGSYRYLVVPTIVAPGFGYLTRWCLMGRSFPHWLTETGRRSFSIYLLHFPIAEFVGTLVKNKTASYVGLPVAFAIAYTIVVVLAYVVARWTWVYIEQTGITLGRKLERRMLSSRQAWSTEAK